MKTGSDDQCRVYLNGKEVFKNAEVRPTEKDDDTAEVTLRKGTNVMVVKVVNEKFAWSFCVRFTDRDDRPLTSVDGPDRSLRGRLAVRFACGVQKTGPRP